MCGAFNTPNGERAQGPLIVVLDRDEAVREALRFSLETEGYRVGAFGDVEALLASSSGLGAACFVVDETIRDPRLRALLQQLGAPVILLSAGGHRSMPGSDQVRIVEKPLITDALSRQIAQALSSRAPTRSS